MSAPTPPTTGPVPGGSSAPPPPPSRARAFETRRLRPLERFGVVFAWGLRRLFKTKKFVWTACLAAAVGVLAGLAMSGVADPAYALWDFLGTAALGVCVPLIALALAAGGFGEEVSEQTLVFHLVRPVSRTTLFVARFVAGLGPAIVASCALALLATALSGVGVGVTTVGYALASAAVGTAAVGAIYYALAALFRRGLVAGLVYTFVIEGFFQFIPGSVQKLALTHHVRSLFHRLCDADFAKLSTRVAREAVRGNASVMRPRSIEDLVPPEPWTTVTSALVICAVVACAALLAGAWTIRRRDFALKE